MNPREKSIIKAIETEPTSPAKHFARGLKLKKQNTTSANNVIVTNDETQ